MVDQWLQPDFPDILLLTVDVGLVVSLGIGKRPVYGSLSQLEFEVGYHRHGLQIYTILAAVKRLVNSCFVSTPIANSGDIVLLA